MSKAVVCSIIVILSNASGKRKSIEQQLCAFAPLREVFLEKDG